jgi:hypothetical protein
MLEQTQLRADGHYRERFPTKCLGRKRKPVQVSSKEICATLSKPPAKTGSHPTSRDRSDFTALDFFGYANHSKPSSTTALNTADATSRTSAFERTNAMTQSTFLSEAFTSLIPSATFARSEAKSGGASLTNTVIPGLIPNFRASSDEFTVLLRFWRRRPTLFLVDAGEAIEHCLLESDAVVGIGMVGGEMDLDDLLVSGFFDGVGEGSVRCREAVIRGDDE